MRDWQVFYRAIGIAENIIDPSYYHLLDLPARDCDADKVARALADKKRRLRQSIPSPEFIAPVLLFEQEVLETAAAVLADDRQRAAYNQSLMSRQRDIEIKNRRKQKLVDDVRAAIAAAVDDKGRLGGVERYLLAEKLRLLEVQEHNVRQILARIPEPADTPFFDQQRLLMFFAGAVQLSITDDVLGAAEEQTLAQLAARLGLDSLQARLMIDQQLAQLSARRQGGPHPEIVLERPVAMDESALIRTDDGCVPKEPLPFEPVPAAADEPDAVDEMDAALAQMHRLTAEKVLRVVVPLLSIALFVATVIFLNAMMRKRQAAPDMSGILPAARPETSAERRLPEQTQAPRPVQSPAAVPGDAAPVGPAPAAVPQVTDIDLPARQIPLSDLADAAPAALLADSAVLMLAVCDRVAGDVGLPNRYAGDLDRLRASADPRAEQVAALASVYEVDVKTDALNTEMVGLRLAALKQRLRSDAPDDRFYAIGRLAAMRQTAADEVLLEALEDTTIPDKSRAMVSRLLAALVQSRRTAVARQLAEIMARSSRQTAFQIQMALMTMTAMTPAGAGVLPVKNNPPQRSDAALWWQQELWSWSGEWVEDLPPVSHEAFETPVRVAAILAELARQAGAMLDEHQSLADEAARTRRLSFKYGFDTADRHRLTASPAVGTGWLAEAVDRQVRQAAPAAADGVWLRRKVALLTAEGDLQIAAANMAAANAGLAVLAGRADTGGRYRELIETLEMRDALPEDDSDAAALRNQCYLHVCWRDLLAVIQPETKP